jgi:predicted nucleic acid-binding protein
MRFLVDANILIYARESPAAAKVKREVATEWLTELARREFLQTNLQVLNEVCHAALRKLRHMSPDDVRSWVGELAAFGDTPIDAEDVARAWDVREAYRFSWFDCLILSSADRLGCTHVLTEDMGSPRRVGPLHLINPFVVLPGDVLSTS